MHQFVSYNQEIIPSSEKTLSGVSSAALYGKGVFTTLAIYNSQPFLWEKHLSRLFRHASLIGIDSSGFTPEKIKNCLRSLLERNQAANARARLTFFEESEPEVWNQKTKTRSPLLIQTADFRTLPDRLKLTVSSFNLNSRSPLTNIKSCNYLENILALGEAKGRGFDESIRLNERGKISSACMANVFWIVNDKLFTPNLETGCLAGTTRELVAEIAIDIGFEYSETSADLNEIMSANEVFLTSSGLSITPVERIDQIKFDQKRTELFRRKLTELIPA